MRTFIMTSLGLAAFPFAVQAACPTAETLTKGAIVFTVDGEEEVHTRAPNGVVTIRTEEDADGVAIQTIAARGIHVLQLADVVDGKLDFDTIWRFAFTDPIEQLPAPTPGGSWLGKSTSYVDGVAEEEDIQHTWGPMEAFTIGSCTFDAIPVRAEFDGEEYDHVEDMIYFPELDTGILIGYSDTEGTDTYTYTDVRAQ